MTDQPHDPAAERAVLGAALLSPKALTETARLLTGDEFWDPRHERIWHAITALADEGVDPDLITLSARLHGQVDPVFLFDLTRVETVPTPANATHYARILLELAERRRALAAATRIAQAAAAGEPGIAVLAEAEVATIHRPDPTEGTTRLGDIVDGVIDDITNPDADPGIPWPWSDVRGRLNPLAGGKLVVVAARAAMGKSVALCDIARAVAVHRQRRCVFHTLEMSRAEVVMRLLAAEAKVPLKHLQERTVTDEEWDRIAAKRAALDAAPLFIVDTPAVGLADIRASIREHTPEVVLLDYLQLAQVNPRMERRQALEEFTRGLKVLAMSEQVALVAAAQLNRGPEQRDGHKPRLSDLRETGAIENDADTVVLLHRPDYYDPLSERAGEVDVIVAKQRNGPTETISLVHQLHYARFVDAA